MIENGLDSNEIIEIAESLVTRENYPAAVHLLEAGVKEGIINTITPRLYHVLDILVSRSPNRDVMDLLLMLNSNITLTAMISIKPLIAKLYTLTGQPKKSLTLLPSEGDNEILKERARAFFAIKKYEKALFYLLRCMSNGKNGERDVLVMLANLMIRAGKYKKALSILEKAIEGENDLLNILLAKCYRKTGNVKRARESINSLIHNNSCPVALIERGLVSIYEMQYKKAVEDIEIAIKSGLLPTPDDYRELIRVLVHIKPKIARIIIKRLKKIGYMPYYHLANGLYLEFNKNPKNAIISYRNALIGASDYSWLKGIIYFNLGLLYLKTGIVKEARKYLDLAIKYRGDDPDVMNAYGVALSYSEKKSRAEKFYKKALETNPYHPYALLNLAKLAIENKKKENALEMVETVIENFPEFLPALRLKARILKKMKLFMEAIEIIDKIEKKSKEYRYECLIEKAELYEKMMLYDNAIETLKRISSLYPNDTYILYRLALLCEKINDLKCAEKYYNRLLSMKPFHKKGLYRMGLVLTARKKYNKAIKVLGKLVNIDPKNIDGLNALAIAYMHSKDYRSALKTIDRAILEDWEYGPSWYNRMKILNKMKANSRIKKITKEYLARYGYYYSTRPLWKKDDDITRVL